MSHRSCSRQLILLYHRPRGTPHILRIVPLNSSLPVNYLRLLAHPRLNCLGCPDCHPCGSRRYTILDVAGQCYCSNPNRRGWYPELNNSASLFHSQTYSKLTPTQPFSIFAAAFFIATTYISLDVGFTFTQVLGTSNPPQSINSIPLFVFTSIWPGV